MYHYPTFPEISSNKIPFEELSVLHRLKSSQEAIMDKLQKYQQQVKLLEMYFWVNSVLHSLFLSILDEEYMLTGSVSYTVANIHRAGTVIHDRTHISRPQWGEGL